MKYIEPTELEMEQYRISVKCENYKKFLNDTQFKFGNDYDKTDTPEWLEIKAKRQEAREFIRDNENV